MRRAAWLMAAWAAACGWAAGGVKYGDVTVSVLPEFGSEKTWHGYMEVRVQVANGSKDRRVVELTVPADKSPGGGDVVGRLSRRVAVEAGATVTASLFQPALDMRGDGLAVSIDGKRQERRVPLTGMHGAMIRESWGGMDRGRSPSVAFSRSVRTELIERVVEARRRSSGSEGAPVGYRAETPVREWTGNWLGYGRFEGVVVTDDDVREMPEPVRTALRQYVECGGVVIVLGEGALPEAFGGATRGTEGGPRFSPDEPRPVGFGFCRAVTEGNLGEAVASCVDGVQPWRQGDIETANAELPVVAGTQVPIRGLMVLVMVFAVLIGPVDLWVLSRWKRRIWLLWIIPAASLLTCGTVFGYALVSEGWRGHIRTKALVLLDENTMRATTLGWTGFYAPLTPGGGLRFDAEAELTPALPREDMYNPWAHRGEGSPRSMDFTAGQHLTDGWVLSRVPAHLRVRCSQSRRERLTVRYGSDGAPTVVNGLGARLREVYLADASGRVWTGGGVAAGAEATLRDAGLTARGDGEASLRSVYLGDWRREADSVAANPGRYLAPGRYVAVMEESPFIAPGLEKWQSRRSVTVIYGILKKDSHVGTGG